MFSIYFNFVLESLNKNFNQFDYLQISLNIFRYHFILLNNIFELIKDLAKIYLTIVDGK